MDHISYSLSLNGTGKVYFPDDIVKNEYVKKEYAFTQREYVKYTKAISLKERKEAKAKLVKRRADFAVSQGYQRTARGSWKKVK